ncbi:MAG TPA: signal peptidase I [Longimicrobiales bacterium]|nr:signal peptidase I [Longimicrobiales bacterium]
MPDSRRAGPDLVVEDRERIEADVHDPVSTGQWAWEWIKSFLIAFGLFLIIRTFVVEAFRIPTGSMENTLLTGDFLLVDKAVFGVRLPFIGVRLPAFDEPQRGDIVVFNPPHEPDRNFVKRLVGVPGDTLEMHGRTLYVNGSPQDEPFARFSGSGDVYSATMFWQCDFAPAPPPTGAACRPTRDNWGALVVPADRFFMLGDNRDDSEDSRYWGFAARDAIKGRPLIIYYSFHTMAGRSFPWLTSIRWGRMGRTVH